MSGTPKTELSVTWSADVPFNNESVRALVPVSPGVYQILQSEEYHRYQGRTRVLKIGMSERNLQAELLNHFRRHAVANRLARVRSRKQMIVSIVFAVVPTERARKAESALLRQFEDEHWDLPLLNANRGYGRDEDKHYCK